MPSLDPSELNIILAVLGMHPLDPTLSTPRKDPLFYTLPTSNLEGGINNKEASAAKPVVVLVLVLVLVHSCATHTHLQPTL